MLREWSIGGFKSFESKDSILLKPLTILSGVNSAGKSTILQSILMCAQTFNEGSSESGPQLNGSLVRLGSFSSICNENLDSPSIVLGWKIDSVGLHLRRNWTKEISVEIEVIPSDVDIYPQIGSFKMVGVHGFGGKISLSIRQSKDDPIKRLERYGLSRYSNVKWLLDAIKFNWTYEQEKSIKIIADQEVIGVVFKGISPTEIIVRIDIHNLISRAVRRGLSGHSVISEISSLANSNVELNLSNQDLRIMYESLPKELAMAIFKKRYSGQIYDDPHFSLSITALLPRIYALNKYQIELLRELAVSFVDEIINNIISTIEYRYDFVNRTIPYELNQSIEVYATYFKESVSHIGPLREEPLPFSPISYTRSPRDVGQYGENSAMVLYHNRSVEIESYIIENERYKKINWTVEELVNWWVKYLNIGDSLTVRDEGHLGYGILINKSRGSYNLTHVGVGVSQIVPIIVASATSKRGSLLLIEQPELHLHPKSQSRLADFLICQSLNGSQIILETHSEYIINRLRRRVVEDDGSSILELSQILFIENTSGRSKIVQVEVNKFGTIKNWPVGFFDQIENDNAHITNAKLSKMRGNG